MSISIDDGTSLAFPNVASVYSIEIQNNGTEDVLDAHVLHNATDNHWSTSWKRSVVNAGVAYSPELDLGALDGRNGLTISGGAEFDQSGRSVNHVGDLNGDGHDDLIISAHLANNSNGVDSGQAIVVYGSDQPFPSNLNASELNGINGFVIEGPAQSQFAGFSVSGAGDFNGDGLDDLIVGAKLANSQGTLQTGKTYLVYGRSILGHTGKFNIASLEGRNGFVIHGIDAFDRSGEAVAGLGDVNGDGFDDILIGATEADANGSRSGESYVIFGGTEIGTDGSFDLSSLSGQVSNGQPLNRNHGFVIGGVREGDFSGHAVSRAGDINNDGVNDLLIGSPEAKFNGRVAAGEAYVVFGGRNLGNSGRLSLANLNGRNGVRFGGGAELERAGSSVSGTGDVNGDGIDDLIIGAPTATPELERLRAGKAYVVFGSASLGDRSKFDLAGLDGSNGFVINGKSRDDQFGSSVSGDLDVNGDGNSDLIIGAPHDATTGVAYVVLGGPGVENDGLLETTDLNGFNGFAMRLPHTNNSQADSLGASVSGAGDLNHDGIDDLIIGANLTDTAAGTDAGRSYVVFGRYAPARNQTSGQHAINETIDIPAGATIRYRVHARTHRNLAQEVVKSVVLNTSTEQLSATDINQVSDQRPLVQFSQTTFKQHEDGRPSGPSITLTRSGDLSVTSTVLISPLGTGSFPADESDFVSDSITVVFTPGVVERRVDLAILQDLVDEDDEQIGLTLTAYNHAAIGATAWASLTILDDDQVGLTMTPVQFEGGPSITNDLALRDGSSPLLFEVKIDTQPKQAVNVRVALNPRTGLSVADGAVTSFHIGNSLTRDANIAKLPNVIGHHFDFGKSLNHIRNNPSDADSTIPPFGNYTPALLNYDWDFVSVQPFAGSSSTLRTDVAFIRHVSSLEPLANLLLYQPWPSLVDTTFADAWNAPLVSNGTATFSANTRAYYASLESELRRQGVSFQTVPMGSIMERIDGAARAGRIPSLSSADELYADSIHLTGAGQAVAYSAFHFAIHGNVPSTIPFPHDLSASTIESINVHIKNASSPSIQDTDMTTLAFNAENWTTPQYVTLTVDKIPAEDTEFRLYGTSRSLDDRYERFWSNTEIASVAVAADTTGDVTSGLVGHWDFETDFRDEANAGNVADHGFAQNGPNLIPGGLGQLSLAVDGENDIVRIPGSTDINERSLEEHSISLWLNPNDINRPGRQVVFEQGGGRRGLNIYVENGWLYAGGWNESRAWEGTWLTAAVDDAKWHHVAVVLDANNNSLSLFVDRELTGAGFGTVIDAHNPAEIGAAGSGTRYFQRPQPGYAAESSTGVFDGFAGQIDDVRVYDRALQRRDIAALASVSPAAVIDTISNLVSHWQFDNNRLDSAVGGEAPDHAILRSTTFEAIGQGSASLEFDGDVSHVELPSSLDINQGDRDAHTISVSFRADNVARANRQVIFRQGGRFRGANIYLDNGKLFMGAWNDDGLSDSFSGSWISGAVTSNAWTHAVLVVDGVAKTVTGYIDGRAIGTLPAGPLRGHNPGSIGAARRFSRYFADNRDGFETQNNVNAFAGNIDDVRIYRRVLTGSQIERLADEASFFTIAKLANDDDKDLADASEPLAADVARPGHDALGHDAPAVDLVFADNRPLFDIVPTPESRSRTSRVPALI